MSGRTPSAYNLFVQQEFRAAGGKTTLAAVAAKWRASGKASGKPSVKRAPAPKCKDVAQSDCNTPCAWRTYGPKSKKTPACYRPRVTRARAMASGVAAAKAAAAPAPAASWRLSMSGQGPQYTQAF